MSRPRSPWRAHTDVIELGGGSLRPDPRLCCRKTEVPSQGQAEFHPHPLLRPRLGQASCPGAARIQNQTDSLFAEAKLFFFFFNIKSQWHPFLVFSLRSSVKVRGRHALWDIYLGNQSLRGIIIIIIAFENHASHVSALSVLKEETQLPGGSQGLACPSPSGTRAGRGPLPGFLLHLVASSAGLLASPSPSPSPSPSLRARGSLRTPFSAPAAQRSVRTRHEACWLLRKCFFLPF